MNFDKKTFSDKYLPIASDITIRYWEAGGSHKQSIILLHGIGSAIESWEGLFSSLIPHYHVLCIDLPGFGKSFKKYKYNHPSEMLHYIKLFIDKKKINNFIAIAHSLGGFATIEYANKYPENIQKLVLIASAGFGKPSIRFRSLASSFSKYFLLPFVKTKYIGPKVFQFFYGKDLSPSSQKALANHWKKKSVLKNFVNILRMSTAYQMAQTENIRCPTLILWGKKDWVLNYKYAYIAKSKIKSSTLEIFDKHGHCLHTEDKNTINTTILNFLKTLVSANWFVKRDGNGLKT